MTYSSGAGQRDRFGQVSQSLCANTLARSTALSTAPRRRIRMTLPGRGVAFLANRWSKALHRAGDMDRVISTTQTVAKSGSGRETLIAPSPVKAFVYHRIQYLGMSTCRMAQSVIPQGFARLSLFGFRHMAGRG